MSGTKRVPLHRRSRTMAITDAALRLFEEMRALPCTCDDRNKHRGCPGCDRWWDLHRELRRALNERMWNFPTISRERPDGRRRWPDDSEQARYLQLGAALKARRAAKAVPEPEPEPEPEPTG